jgi:outer membrane protein TolC
LALPIEEGVQGARALSHALLVRSAWDLVRRPIMERRRRVCLSLSAALVAGSAGCAQVPLLRRPESVRSAMQAASLPEDAPHGGIARLPEALASKPGQVAPEPNGPQPVEEYVRRALVENRTIQAAFHNVQALKHRIPQVTALDDPVVSNTIFPIPSVGPQYSIMGYNPYNLMLEQQFPWFGTLRLRGAVAEKDVQVALAELAAAQLDAILAVKRAYCDLYSNQKSAEILADSRLILEDFKTIARQRLTVGGSAQDVIKTEVLITELDRDLASDRAGIATARAALARQIHASPEADLRTLSQLPIEGAPAEVDRLFELAVTARPELRGRLEAIARDDKAVELARKRAHPNLTLGLAYMDMTRQDAISRTAIGSPNVGLFVGFNLPVNQAKYRAGVCEAQERAIADAKLFEAQQDATRSEIYDLMVQAKVQQNVLQLLRDTLLPRSRETLELAKSDYARSNAEIGVLISAMREVLKLQVQIAQVEAELGKALALLERAVGTELSHRR